MTKFELVERPSILYRVTSLQAKGLWYDSDGKFTNLISDIPGTRAAQLPMPKDDIFSADNQQWLSATDSPDALRNWFSLEDVYNLLERDYRVVSVFVPSYRKLFFDGYAHEVFSTSSVKSVEPLEPSVIWTDYKERT